MLINASTHKVDAFSFPRALVAGVWSGCAFSLAQLAEGYAINLVLTLAFACVVATIAGRLHTAIGFGMYLMSCVALGAVVVSSFGFGTSLAQFFPDVWGPIDYLLVLLLWLSPLMAVLVSCFELKVQRWITFVVAKYFSFSIKVQIPSAPRHRNFYFGFERCLIAFELTKHHPRRGPPSLVVA